MSEYSYWISCIAKTREAGNALAAALNASPADANAFACATPLYPPGTTFSGGGPMQPPTASNPPSAYYLGTSARQEYYDLAVEFSGDGPYPLLNARGKTDEQIAALKTLVAVESGARNTAEPRWSQFVAEQGYVV